MKKQDCKRYDAAGHVILPHGDMILYYKKDPASLNLVRRYMPHRYVCLPDIEIHIFPSDTIDVQIYLIYPGETKNRYLSVSVRALEGLRATYRGKPGWKAEKRENGSVVLRRQGRVIMDPLKRFGVWPSAL